VDFRIISKSNCHGNEDRHCIRRDSDYRILKHITERYLREEDAYVIPLKPKESMQGKQDGFGSWQGVLQYISGADQMILEALNEGCRYVVVHIDTDVRSQYGIAENYDNADSLHESVCERLLAQIHPDFDRDRVIFAIAIHETECWLLSFLSDDKKIVCKTDSCVNSLNRPLKDRGSIDKDNKNADKARATYEYILKLKKKSKDIKAASLNNLGFLRFIESLDRIKESDT